MKRTILITGGFGFLGRAVAKNFTELGYRVVGIGHRDLALYNVSQHLFDVWVDADVTLSGLMSLRESFDLILHAAGNGSVGYSLLNPLQDFDKTVRSTAELLEFMRVTESSALLIYPSSAGVYGAKEDKPIKENDALNPISPYGYNKKIVEDLLTSYSAAYGVRVAIIRYFSIYGPGLKKQLLWDASIKLRASSNGLAMFWGTGEETRDWISSEDAAALVHYVSKTNERFSILNGASGLRVTVGETLKILKSAMDVRTKIVFNGNIREGDPHFYHADVSKSLALGWAPCTLLSDGIESYVRWQSALGDLR
jgi:UDP-glucose 4-epimerase